MRWGHWGVEYRLHWCLDVIVAEDKSRVRKDQRLLNLSMICRLAWRFAKEHLPEKQPTLQTPPRRLG
jgi:predicted transposase YbfD/YdcC